MKFVIKNIQYHPNDGPIAVYYEQDAAKPRIRNFINLSQETVAALAPAGQQWGDDEVLTAARSQLLIDQPEDPSDELNYPVAQ